MHVYNYAFVLSCLYIIILRSRKQTHDQGWPEPYTYIVHAHIFGEFPAKNTVYTPYIYGYGQPYT